MNPPAQTQTLRQAVRFGLAMLVSAWALAFAVPLLRYSAWRTRQRHARLAPIARL